ncbi:hypothetical protein [Mangrovivirga cuniculi]|uniref:Uncharacterized protein n=1 Tax=Mangrovivirga cuniculi TaxID=2715131 RepID=A0A4D7K7K1_9BACT|nr:hypothetical protein [Mangrovivirga cuniculi]QCK16704.1 hypothetical protein DCC35_19180 [Mangrovivirga cuniculi]
MLLEPGENYDNKIGDYRFFSSEECNVKNAKLLEDFEKKADNINVKPLPKKFSFKVYDIPANSMDELVVQIGVITHKLSNSIKAGPVLFLSDFAIPWLSQNNEFPPVKNAQEYLKKLGIDEKFSGGFLVNESDLMEFMSHLFWLIRCNAELPPCYFTFEKFNFITNLCQYGNFHFTFYCEEERIELEKVFDQLGMNEVPGGFCYERFSEGSSIEGRRIEL